MRCQTGYLESPGRAAILPWKRNKRVPIPISWKIWFSISSGGTKTSVFLNEAPEFLGLLTMLLNLSFLLQNFTLIHLPNHIYFYPYEFSRRKMYMHITICACAQSVGLRNVNRPARALRRVRLSWDEESPLFQTRSTSAWPSGGTEGRHTQWYPRGEKGLSRYRHVSFPERPGLELGLQKRKRLICTKYQNA